MTRMSEITPIIHTETMLGLDSSEPIITPRLEHAPKDIRFGIENMGRLLLRMADGTRSLVPEQGGHLLGLQGAIRTELQEQVWPVYELSEPEKLQLSLLGIDTPYFPPFIYELPRFSRFYGSALGDKNAPFPGVRCCSPRDPYKYPRVSDIDRRSMECLGKLWGLEVRPNTFVGLPAYPSVVVDGQLRQLSGGAVLAR